MSTNRTGDRIERLRQWCHAQRGQGASPLQSVADDVEHVLGRLDAARAANSAVHGLCRAAVAAYEKDPTDPATRGAADLAGDIQYVMNRAGSHRG